MIINHYDFFPKKLAQYRINKWTGSYIEYNEHGSSEEVTEHHDVWKQISLYEMGWYKNQPDGLVYYEDWLVDFKGSQKGVTHLSIKEGTRYIASRACMGMDKTVIDIPNSVIKIAEDAFKWVPNINYHGNAKGKPWGARFVNGYFEGNFVFSDKTKTSLIVYIGEEDEVSIPQGVNIIGPKAFYMNNLKSVDIPDSVQFIRKEAFSSNRNLSSVRIPNSLLQIHSQAFSGCYALRNLIIPDGVKYIDDDAFEDISNIVYHGRAIGAPWGARCMNGHIEGNLIFSDKTKTTVVGLNNDVQSVDIPDTVETITHHAFRDCSLQEIKLPNSIKKIEEGTFCGCSSLKSIIIPDSVKSIGDDAFDGCSSLTSITIPNRITSIGNYAFNGCSSLTSFTIPNPITSIGNCVFQDCKSLTSIIIPCWVKSIGMRAFENCKSLTSIIIPSNVKSIGYSAFRGCESLENVVVSASVEEIDMYAFENCPSLSEDSIKSIKAIKRGCVF